MWLFRAVLSSALAVYIVAAPTDDLTGLARAWAWYGFIDGIAALIPVTVLPSRDVRFGPFLVQGGWSLGAGVVGVILPYGLYLLLFVVMPLWSIGSMMLALVGLMRIRDVVENGWLITLALLAAAAFTYIFVSSPAGDVTWLKAMVGAFAVVNGAAFLLTARSVRITRVNQGA